MTDDLDLRGIDHRHEPDPQFRAALQRRLAAIVAGTDPGSVTEARHLAIDLEPTSAMPAPEHNRRRVATAILAAVAAVIAIALVAVRVDDAAPADQLAVDSWFDKLMVRPLDSPIDCGLEQCPWSPELTAQALGPAFACTGPPGKPLCPLLAVSPDGTLVALDRNAGTLTWYEEEPRVVPVTLAHPPSIDEDSGFVAMAIGPHNVAYFSIGPRPSALVAVAPSGAEITRVETPRGAPRLYPTATGLGAIFVDRLDDGQLMPPNGALWMPWVDLDGNPITDDTPYPTATATERGLEVRLGDREWLLVVEELHDEAGLLTFPRSDGGVVMIINAYNGQEINEPLLYLSTDGTIQRYFVNVWSTAVLPDGSLIVAHDHQLFRLTPPA